MIIVCASSNTANFRLVSSSQETNGHGSWSERHSFSRTQKLFAASNWTIFNQPFCNQFQSDWRIVTCKNNWGKCISSANTDHETWICMKSNHLHLHLGFCFCFSLCLSVCQSIFKRFLSGGLINWPAQVKRRMTCCWWKTWYPFCCAQAGAARGALSNSLPGSGRQFAK